MNASVPVEQSRQIAWLIRNVQALLRRPAGGGAANTDWATAYQPSPDSFDATHGNYYFSWAADSSSGSSVSLGTVYGLTGFSVAQTGLYVAGFQVDISYTKPGSPAPPFYLVADLAAGSTSVGPSIRGGHRVELRESIAGSTGSFYPYITVISPPMIIEAGDGAVPVLFFDGTTSSSVAVTVAGGTAFCARIN